MKQIFSLLILSLIASSCALLQPAPDKLNKSIQHWLEKNEFDKIETAIKKIDNNPDFAEKYKTILILKPEIKEKKALFIENTSSHAQQLKKSQEWQQALSTYNNALNKISNSPRLIDEKANLLKERDELVTALKKDMLMQRANALISYKKIYEKLFKLIPDDHGAQLDIKHYDKNRISVAHQLKLCGDQARDNKQFLLASDCYSLSNKLDPTEEKSQWVTVINKQLVKQSTQTSNDLSLAEYHVAYNKREYNLARSHLKTLLAMNPSHAKTKSLLKSLNKEVSEMVLKKINIGKDLYSKKKIDDALKIWQQALLLEPDNTEVIQLISRAKKVSEKIQSLEKNQ